MYLPAHFEEKRPEALQQLIRKHPLGVLVTLGQEGLNANHVPFEFDPEPQANRDGVVRGLLESDEDNAVAMARAIARGGGS